MKKLHVTLPEETSLEYDILIENGILDQAGELIRQSLNKPGAKPINRLALISDETVYALYGKRLEASLSKAGLSYETLIMPPGEYSKSILALTEVYSFFAENTMTRADMALAFGGGVIGDLVGFSAATYMRGIPFVQIPTTLLAQVDSSIGGKTAINLKQGKNLVGAFNQPSLVLSDPKLLETLSDREFACGMAEVVKYAAISSYDLLEILEKNDTRQKASVCMEEIITLCCEMKRKLVEMDPYDKKERRLLNFGHTFGHAIEKFFDYSTFNHGEAISMGMKLALLLAERLGLGPYEERIVKLLEGFGLPVHQKFNAQSLLPLLGLDKKAMGKELNFVFVREIGDSFVHSISAEALNEVVDENFVK